MATQEIPRDDWTAFFDRFNRQHEGWLVTVEVLAADIGAQVEARELALEGITYDAKGSNKDTILIDVAENELTHVAHTVMAPTHLRLKETDEGAHEALEIEAADGTITLVRFRSAVLPETVDGIVG